MTEAAAGHAERAERDAAWLAVAQSLAARAAHDVKNALNGVAVNVEVVRARAARGAGGEKIAPFADTAASQLEGAVALVEALLSLGRPAREPAQAGGVGAVVRALAPLVATSGHPVELTADDAQTPALDGETLRTVVTAALVAMVDGRWGAGTGAVVASGGPPTDEGAAAVSCEVGPDRAGGIRVHMRGARPAEMPAAVLRLAAGAGVMVTPGPDGIDMKIPAAETR